MCLRLGVIRLHGIGVQVYAIWDSSVLATTDVTQEGVIVILRPVDAEPAPQDGKRNPILGKGLPIDGAVVLARIDAEGSISVRYEGADVACPSRAIVTPNYGTIADNRVISQGNVLRA